MNWTEEEIQAIVDEHALVLFMKGTQQRTMWLFQSCCSGITATW